MKPVFKSAIDAIGNTPLVQLSRVYKGPGKIFGKMEFINPGGSVKDRAALRIIQDAYAAGRLEKGQPVVEMTSGNMGAGAAVVCAALGNPFIAVMSEGNSIERRKMLQSLGAELYLVPQVDGIPGQVTGKDIEKADELARTLAKAKNGLYLDQFNNHGCMYAHYDGTGPEIYRDLEGKIDAFVACVGSGGTFVGTSKFLKEQNPNIFCAAVEPEGAEILAGKGVVKPKHIIQGTGYCMVPIHWEKGLADDFIAINDTEVVAMTRKIATLEGFYVGLSSGANVCAAIKLLERHPKLAEKNASVVTVLCDTGLKYDMSSYY